MSKKGGGKSGGSKRDGGALYKGMAAQFFMKGSHWSSTTTSSYTGRERQRDTERETEAERCLAVISKIYSEYISHR